MNIYDIENFIIAHDEWHLYICFFFFFFVFFFANCLTQLEFY